MGVLCAVLRLVTANHYIICDVTFKTSIARIEQNRGLNNHWIEIEVGRSREYTTGSDCYNAAGIQGVGSTAISDY